MVETIFFVVTISCWLIVVVTMTFSKETYAAAM